MDTKLPTLEKQVYLLVQSYREVLEVAGIRDLPSTRQNIAEKQILKVVKPRTLRVRIRSLLEYHCEDGRLKN